MRLTQSLEDLREQAALLECYHFIVLDLVEADRFPADGEKYQTIASAVIAGAIFSLKEYFGVLFSVLHVMNQKAPARNYFGWRSLSIHVSINIFGGGQI